LPIKAKAFKRGKQAVKKEKGMKKHQIAVKAGKKEGISSTTVPPRKKKKRYNQFRADYMGSEKSGNMICPRWRLRSRLKLRGAD